MGVAEALVLFLIGLLCGVFATVFDVLVTGAGSFLAHFGLWVLLNALVAVHVEGRGRAIWWSLPFNLGFIESYFIATVASYEGFSKSLAVPLAAVALLSPLLSYGLWTAKNQKNVFGRVLSIIIVGESLVACYVVDRHLGIYDCVTCALTAYVLLAMPVRRLTITPSRRLPDELVSAGDVRDTEWDEAQAPGQETPGAAPVDVDGAAALPVQTSPEYDEAPQPVRRARATSSGEQTRERRVRKGMSRKKATRERGAGAAGAEKSAVDMDNESVETARRRLRPTRRTRSEDESSGSQRREGTSRRRRASELVAEERRREERRRSAAARRASQRERERAEYEGANPYEPLPTLGNSRVARRSVRNR